jgi:hypothetical protein
MENIMSTNAYRHAEKKTCRLFARSAARAMILPAVLAVGCEPAAKSPVDQATFMESTRCGPEVNDGDLAPVLSGQAIQGVGPLYSTVEAAKSGKESQLRGVIVMVNALPGVSAEWLDRELECHGARLTLGGVQSSPYDPFWLPGSTVDVDVRPAKDGFAVGIAGYSSADARRIFERAQAFAKAKGVPASK